MTEIWRYSMPDLSHDKCCKEATFEKIQKELNTGILSFQRLDSKLESMTNMLSDIRVQTRKTNGRVNNMERLALMVKVVLITTAVIILFQKFGLWTILLKLIG